jgi:hypothetical protein
VPNVLLEKIIIDMKYRNPSTVNTAAICNVSLCNLWIMNVSGVSVSPCSVKDFSFYCGATVPSGLRPLHYRGFIRHTTLGGTPLDE